MHLFELNDWLNLKKKQCERSNVNEENWMIEIAFLFDEYLSDNELAEGTLLK